MLVKDLIERLRKFNPHQEVLVMGPPDEGDVASTITSLDMWDVGANGACVITVVPEDSLTSPEQQMPPEPVVPGDIPPFATQ